MIEQLLQAKKISPEQYDIYMLQASLAGATHNWGQTGTAFHSIADGWDRTTNLNQLLKDNLGRDLYQLKQIAKLGSRYDSPAKISKMLKDNRLGSSPSHLGSVKNSHESAMASDLK